MRRQISLDKPVFCRRIAQSILKEKYSLDWKHVHFTRSLILDQVLWNCVDTDSSGIAKNEGVVTVDKIAVGDGAPPHSLLTRKVRLE